MKFTIITHVKHKYHEDGIYAYEPYVREMNLWGKHVESCKVVGGFSPEPINVIDSKYEFKNIHLEKVPSFDILFFKNKLQAILKIPVIVYKIFKACYWADHIHLRCPGNIGLLGCFVQIFYPFKKKTVKYAGNWNPKSRQPLSYRIQKWIVSNRFLTHNCKVLVYGEWKKQSKNILPFFTATYNKSDIKEIPQKKINGHVRVVFVGSFTKSKQPLLSVKSVQQLKEEGYDISLHMYGEGEEFNGIKSYILENQSENFISLHGNQSKETVKKAFQESHFLLFVSKSEGWPKVVAEAMFWSCLPLSSPVSCIPFMLDQGKRGALVKDTIDDITTTLKRYLNNPDMYQEQVELAKKWSQEFTLDKFELEISKLL